MREFLERNKIFVEIFSGLLLGAMALIVSFASLQVSRNQTRLQEVQVSPSFSIQIHQKFNEASQKFSDGVLTIDNNGYSISEFSAKLMSFFQVTRTNRHLKEATEYIPIVYLCCQFSTQDGTGRLTTFKQRFNESHASRLERELRKIKVPGDIEYSGGVINILTVSYKDSLGKYHTKTYDVRYFNGGIELDISKEEFWKNHYRANGALQSEISSLTAEILIEKFKSSRSLSSS